MTYYEKTISQYPSNSIALVCKEFHNTQQLSQAAEKPFCGFKQLTSDRILLKAAEYYLYCIQDEYVFKDDDDIQILFQRCLKKIRCLRKLFREAEIDYDLWFEFFVDFCWLISSIKQNRASLSPHVYLIKQPVFIRKYLRDALDDIYKSAQHIEREVYRMEEARKYKYQFFKGLYTFRYPESKEYIDFSSKELENMITRASDEGIHMMSLYFGLTATAVKANYIWSSER